MLTSASLPAQDFLLFVAIVAGTPGPLNLAIFAIGLANRARLGLGVVLGGALAYGTLYAATSSNAGYIAALDQNVFDGLQMMAAAVLIWLAWKIAMSEVGHNRTEARLNRAGRGLGAGTAAGMGVVAVGTKSWTSAVGAGVLFHDSQLSATEHALTFGVTAMALVLVLSLLWLSAGLLVGRSINSPLALKGMNVAGGGCLALMAGVILVA